MWYRTAKKLALAQELNIPAPIQGVPGAGRPAPVWAPPVQRRRRVPVAPSPPQQMLPPEATDPNQPIPMEPGMAPPPPSGGEGVQQPPTPPTQQAPQVPQQPSLPDDGKPDQPEPIPLEPEDEKVLGMQPPLHDRCHCTIESLPGGRKIWHVNDTACEQCQMVGRRFNELQSAAYGA